MAINNKGFGRVFCPSEEELISYYLKNRILNVPLKNSKDSLILWEDNMYGAEATPWKLFPPNRGQYSLPWMPQVDSMGNPTDPVLYVFATLSNVGKTEKSWKTQKNRIAGCGTWQENTTAIPVYDNRGKGNRVIGHKGNFTFRTTKGEPTVGQWTTTEYSMDPGSGIRMLEGFDSSDYVLCKIKRDDTKCSVGGKLVISRKRNIVNVPLNEPPNKKQVVWSGVAGDQQHYDQRVFPNHQETSSATPTTMEGISNTLTMTTADDLWMWDSSNFSLCDSKDVDLFLNSLIKDDAE